MGERMPCGVCGIGPLGSKDAEKGEEGKTNAIGGGETEWVKVRVAGRKVNEAFLTQKENEVRRKSFWTSN